MDTNIYLIIDGSGSMSGVKGDVVQGINDFIKEQQADTKKSGDQTLLSLTSFDTNVNIVYDAEDISLVASVGLNDTFLGGGTALFDAIGKTLTLAENNPAPRNLVVIYTDGEENSSSEFKRADIEELVKKLDKSGSWQFIYLGAEFAEFKTDEAFASLSGASMSSMNTSKGQARIAFTRLSDGASYYRSATMDQVATMDDRGGIISSSAIDAGVDWKSVEDKNGKED